MDFIAFDVYYYLSEQDKQNFLNALDFAGSQRYQDLYDRWFSDPNNPITNATKSTSYTLYISYCFQGVFYRETETFSATPAEAISRQSIKSQLLANQNYVNTRVDFTDAPDRSCVSGNTGGTGGTGGNTGGTGGNTGGTGGNTGGGTSTPDKVGVTVYIAYCNNQVLQKESGEYFIFENQTSRQQLLQNVKLDFESRGFKNPITSLTPITENINCITVSIPPSSQNVFLYTAYCDGSQLRTQGRTISVSSDPTKINEDKSRQRASIKTELETRYGGVVYVDFTPPSSFPNCETGNSDTLYAIYCDRGSPQKSQTTVIFNNIDEKNRKKIDYENTLRGLGFTNPETSFTPFGRNASCGSTSPPDNLSKAKEVILKYCDNGNIITVNKIIAYTNENDFNTKLIQYKQQLIGQNGILTSVRLSINDPKVSIGIDKNPPDPTCGGPKITKVYIAFCQSNNTVGRFIADVAVDNSKPNNIFQAAIDSVIKEQVTDKGGKNPRYNIGSYPSDPTCIESSGGGNEGGKIRNGTLKVQIQFEENGLIVDAFSQLRPSVNVNGSKPLSPFIDSNLLKLGPSASSRTYEIDNKSYFVSPSTNNILTFSTIPGWITPSPFTFLLQKSEDNAPPGGTREFGSYYLFRYTRTTGTTGGGVPPSPEPEGPSPSPGPGPSGPGPGPSGPGPTPPPPPTTTTTTLRIPDSNWLKRINPIDNRKYVFDITEGLFSNNERNLVTFFTGSTSENYSRYYTHVYDENPKTSLTSSIQFSIAYGHSGGSGSLDEGNKINITPTRAIYSQYRNLVLGRPDVKFNLTGRDTDSIYVVNYQSKRLKDRLDAGVLELNIAHLSGSRFLAGGGTRATHTGSNVKLAGNNRVLRLIDDSKININPDYTDVGYSYNIVSGTLETGVYNKSSPHYYGKLIPSLGVVLLDGNKLDLSASFATSNASEIEGYNAIKLYKSFSGSALIQDISGDYLGMKARRVIREYNDYYFIRINNREFNFTNNNSYFIYNKKDDGIDFITVGDRKIIRRPGDLSMPLDPNSPEGRELAKRLTETNGEIYENFLNNPQVYITTVGLYNAQRELVAVGKLAKPILKNFTEESIFTVKLKY